VLPAKHPFLAKHPLPHLPFLFLYKKIDGGEEFEREKRREEGFV